MSWRGIAATYAVLAVLAGYYLAFERRPGPAPARPAGPLRLVDVRAGAVRELKLVRGTQRVVCRRQGGRWVVAEPAGAVVPSDLIAALAEGLTGDQGVEVVAEGGPRAGEFPLTGGTRVELVLDGRATPVEVVLGGLNPTRTAIYARRAGDPRVYLLGRNIRYYEDLIFAAAGRRQPSPARGPRHSLG